MYKDANGKRIKESDVVAHAIAINHDTFKGFSFSTNVCKKQGRELILDGVHEWIRLRDCDPKGLYKIDGLTDMRRLQCYFLRNYPRKYGELV